MWLTSEEGPLAPRRISRDRLKGVELNVQVVRWPSTVRPDLGGHAEYLLRALRPAAGGSFAPGPLDNTPDVDRIHRDRALQADLVRWMRDETSLGRIDAGTSVLPERFAATRAFSVSPRGAARRANRPFRRLVDARALAGIDWSTLRVARSPSLLLRRLDELSCPGCHQSRSVAGFHLLGEDVPEAPASNAIASAISPHLAADLARRRAEVAALASGSPRPPSSPFAERGEDERGNYGAHCARTSDAPRAWTCEPPFVCTDDDSASDESDVGVCLPNEGPGPGDPCEVGKIDLEGDAHRDRVVSVARRGCGSGVCERTSVGFPGGMCSSSCDSLRASAVCGRIAILTDFNDCLAQRKPFDACLAEHTRPAGLRACDAVNACRDDYICARTPEGRGACIPPYFLFQLRVDGHPLARRAR
jgi:hypothetical protein